MVRVCVAAALATLAAQASAEELVILSLQSNDLPRQALETLAADFAKATPGTTPRIVTMQHEALKATVQKQLRSGKYDILTWHAGNRGRLLAERGLLDPIDGLIPNQDEFSPGVQSSVTFDGKLYCVPHAYYHWTLYYNRTVLERAGVKPPQTWPAFISAVKTIREKGFTPIALGTREPWTTGGWFDFLGLNTYGPEFHLRLMRGEESYTNKKVSKAVGHWTELVKAGAFNKDHRTLSWSGAAQLLQDGKAGMMLMGNFWIGESKIPTKGTDVASFRFPSIEPGLPLVGIAPTDVFCLPAKAPHKDRAAKFLAFAARAEVQEKYARMLQVLPPNRKAAIDQNDEFNAFGKSYLEDAASIFQFYDRETDPEVARRGMDMMVNLVDEPGAVDSELEKVEKVRKRVYRK